MTRRALGGFMVILGACGDSDLFPALARSACV
jgi:hypothetical protein